jgi:hypothetical protein
MFQNEPCFPSTDFAMLLFALLIEPIGVRCMMESFKSWRCYLKAGFEYSRLQLKRSRQDSAVGEVVQL